MFQVRILDAESFARGACCFQESQEEVGHCPVAFFAVGGITEEPSARFQAMLASEMRAAVRTGEVNLKGAGLSAAAAAELVQLGASGLKQGAPDVATLKRRLRRFIRIFFAGLR